MKGECYIFNSIKVFIQKNKSYIIIILILIISFFSIIYQQRNNQKNININGEEIILDKVEGQIAVYIVGEVKSPGVYYIDEDSRLDDLIEMCGGFTSNADLTDLNLADKLCDSDKIIVPKIGIQDEVEYIESETSNGLVNINTASKDELKQLNGIGDTLANNIIEYRKNTRFESIEDLLNVNGIGESKFEAIEEYICVD